MTFLIASMMSCGERKRQNADCWRERCVLEINVELGGELLAPSFVDPRDSAALCSTRRKGALASRLAILIM